MASPISGINGVDRALLSMPSPTIGKTVNSASQAVDFQSMLLDVLGDANAADGQAQQAIQNYQMDSGITKPEVFIAMRKAELAMRTTMQIRNKLVDMFKEIQQMRM